MKLRRLSKSHLLVLGAFLAAGAAALPALAVRAGGEPDRHAFPAAATSSSGCGFSHRNNDDAIALAGQPGASHNHTYIGNMAVDAATTAASLVGGQSTCGDVGDASAYWVPTLYAGRRALRPLVSVGYYVRRTSGPVQAFPAGLKMIAGDAKARRQQPLARVGWACGGFGATPRSATVPACPPDRSLHMRVTFPNCWNGRDLDSADHKRHLAYARRALSAFASDRAAEPRPDLPLRVDRKRSPGPGIRPVRHACRLHQRLGSGNPGTVGGSAELTRYNARPRGYSSAGRAPGSHPGGRRFEPA